MRGSRKFCRGGPDNVFFLFFFLSLTFFTAGHTDLEKQLNTDLLRKTIGLNEEAIGHGPPSRSNWTQGRSNWTWTSFEKQLDPRKKQLDMDLLRQAIGQRKKQLDMDLLGEAIGTKGEAIGHGLPCFYLGPIASQGGPYQIL